MEAAYPISEPCLAAMEDAEEGGYRSTGVCMSAATENCQIAVQQSHEDAVCELRIASQALFSRKRDSRDAWKLDGRMREGCENENRKQASTLCPGSHSS